MRTKTISRWRRAALATATAASLALPLHAQAQDDAAAPAAPENGKIPAANTAPPADSGPTQNYTIQRGDTLWDLSQKFLANPWYWPKIWSLNPSIENPHWIYPGQTLQIRAGSGGGPAQVDAPAQGAPGTEQASAQASPEGTPDAAAGAPGAEGTQLGVEGSAQEAAASQEVVSTSGRLAFKPPAVLSVRAPGLVGQQEIDNAGVLDASFEEKGMISTYDTAYARFKDENAVRVGDRLTIFRPDGDISNPKTGEKLAVRTKSVGEAKVIAIGGGVVTVQVTSEREEVERGDLVRPWADDARRLAPKANSKQLDATILSNVEDSIAQLGNGQQVYIDKGKNDGVEAGNTFLVIAHGDGLGDTDAAHQSYAVAAEDEQKRKSDPDETIGMLMVIDARDNVSTAVIVRCIRELEAGDKLQMRAATGG
jgi:LysM repeat protein